MGPKSVWTEHAHYTSNINNIIEQVKDLNTWGTVYQNTKVI
jgi:hypothetical protein